MAKDTRQLPPSSSDAGASLFGRRRARLGSAALAMVLAAGLSLFVLGRGPGSLVWLNGAAPQWLPFAGTGVSWLPLVTPAAEPTASPATTAAFVPPTQATPPTAQILASTSPGGTRPSPLASPVVASSPSPSPTDSVLPSPVASPPTASEPSPQPSPVLSPSPVPVPIVSPSP